MALQARSPLPSFAGAERWANGGEPTEDELAGKPVFVHFWSIGCYICHDVAEQIAAWREKFEPMGMAFVAIHHPRSEEELDPMAAIADAQGSMHITHRLGLDHQNAIAERFENQFVPAYFVFDRTHELRHFQAGDKGYDRIESAIERVLAEEPSTLSS